MRGELPAILPPRPSFLPDRGGEGRYCTVTVTDAVLRP